MSKFTKYRKKARIADQERYERLVKGSEQLEEFNSKVQRLFKENPNFELNPNNPENWNKYVEIWNKYVNEYHETLTDEFA